MADFFEFPTGKRIIDNGKCNNCKFNVGYNYYNPTNIWCDKYLCFKNITDKCEKYIFRLEKTNE